MTLRAERFFQIALLGGRQVVIEDDDVGIGSDCAERASSSHLARADQVAASGAGRDWMTRSSIYRAGAGGQFGQLLQGLFGTRTLVRADAGAAAFPLQPDQDRAFRTAIHGVALI